MKKSFKILFLTTAALILTALPAIPHHHHGGEACLAHQLCHEDEADNDRHTEHHDDGTQCVEHTPFVAPEKAGDDDSGHLLQPAPAVLPQSPSAPASSPALEQILPSAPCGCPQKGAPLSTSLRAPPAAL